MGTRRVRQYFAGEFRLRKPDSSCAHQNGTCARERRRWPNFDRIHFAAKQSSGLPINSPRPQLPIRATWISLRTWQFSSAISATKRGAVSRCRSRQTSRPNFADALRSFVRRRSWSKAAIPLSASSGHDVDIPNAVRSSCGSNCARLERFETSKEAVIIYNPTRNNTEYFMIEDRYKGALPIRNYDSFISASVVAGPVLWHASSRTPPSIQIYPPSDRRPGRLARSPDDVWLGGGRHSRLGHDHSRENNTPDLGGRHFGLHDRGWRKRRQYQRRHAAEAISKGSLLSNSGVGEKLHSLTTGAIGAWRRSRKYSAWTPSPRG